MKKYFFVYTYLFCLQLTIVHGQNTFEAFFGGSTEEAGYAIDTTHDGGFILAGLRSPVEAGYFVRTDAFGNEIWSKYYTDFAHFIIHDVQILPDSNYILVGSIDRNLNPDVDILLMKVDTSGNEIWSRPIGKTDAIEVAYNVAITPDNGFIVAGETESYGSFDRDGLLVKTDRNGIVQWDTIIRGPETGSFRDVSVTIDSGYVVVGVKQSSISNGGDVWMLSLDQNLNLLWETTLGGSAYDVAMSIYGTTDNGFAVLAHSESFGSGLSDWYLIRLDSFGDTIWTRTFGGAGWDIPREVRQTYDGGFLMCGNWAAGSQGAFCRITKTNSGGLEEWSRNYRKGQARGIIQLSDRGFALVGQVYYTSALDEQAYLVRGDSTGNVIISNDNIEEDMPLLHVTYESREQVFQFQSTDPKLVNAQLELFSITGTPIFDTAFRGGKALIKAHTMSHGLYFWRLITANGHAFSGKFVHAIR